MRAHDSLPALSDYLDPRWRELLLNSTEILSKLEDEIDFSQNVPRKELVFKAFDCDPKSISVVIFGQDPYPNELHAMGLAFSVGDDVEILPASLRNIFTELRSDIGCPAPTTGNLSFLSEQGVMLLNRGLTLNLKDRRVNPLWYEFTDEVAQVLAKLGVVGIFWGNQAQELAKYFPQTRRILGVHPSPLSAYKGFFGSKPFSIANKILLSENKPAINWIK